jgi:hypothetical protein
MNKAVFVTSGLAAVAAMTVASCSPKDTRAKLGGEGMAAWTTKDFSIYFQPIRKDVAVASPALFARLQKLEPVNMVKIPKCGGTLPAPTTSRLVKLVIKDGFDVKDTGREAYAKNRGGGGRNDVPQPALNAGSTTYDLNLDKSVWAGSSSQYIAVSVYLKDDFLSFVNDDLSITAMDAPGMFYCLENIKSIPDHDDGDPEDDKQSTSPSIHNWNVATFYVDGTQKAVQKFNIWVVVRHKKHNPSDWPYVLPVIIDPIMDNNGFS